MTMPYQSDKHIKAHSSHPDKNRSLFEDYTVEYYEYGLKNLTLVIPTTNNSYEFAQGLPGKDDPDTLNLYTLKTNSGYCISIFRLKVMTIGWILQNRQYTLPERIPSDGVMIPSTIWFSN